MGQPLTAAVRYLSGEREPVRVATTGNITLQGLFVVDDVDLEVGDRVLVRAQTDAVQNGIYLASEGVWFRAPDASWTRAINKGTTVTVQEGTAFASRVFAFQAQDPVVGTDAITLARYFGDTAFLDIGTTAGTVAAGDDERIVNAILKTGAHTNQLPRSDGAGSYNWVSALYETQQGAGQLDLGATYSIMAHTGSGNSLGGGLWPSRDTTPPQAGVNGFTDSGIATYQGVGSVSLYVDIAGPPPVATLPGTFTATTWVPSSALSGAVLAKMFVGQYLLVQGTNYWGKVTAFTASTVTVSGWYQNGNTAAGQVPAGTQNVIIGVVTKIWAQNTNALLGTSSYADQAIGFELGAGNYKSSYDLATATGAQVNGLNVASIGTFNNHWAVLVTRQTGDGTWARGVYVAGTTYSAFTAGSWAGDTQAPAYGFQYNWTTGKAFAINGSVSGGSERYYVDANGNLYTQANIGVGKAPSAGNSITVRGGGAVGATNILNARDSADAFRMGILDDGRIQLAVYTVSQLNAMANKARGQKAYASDCRVFNGSGTFEGPGAGTGGEVAYNGTSWKIAGTNVTAVA